MSVIKSKTVKNKLYIYNEKIMYKYVTSRQDKNKKPQIKNKSHYIINGHVLSRRTFTRVLVVSHVCDLVLDTTKAGLGI